VTPSRPVPLDQAAHILVVDDDTRIRSLLSRFLRENGYRVSTAENAADARAKLAGLAFDLIVLDVMMPGESGISLATHLRGTTQVPILMLTARAEVEDRVAGLETGVDDYVTKPFEPRELLLRIGGILRRAATPGVTTPDLPVNFGPFTFHPGRGELRRGEDGIRLTERERDILRLLIETPGETVSREALSGQSAAVNERTIDVQINRLRRKIESDPANPVYLQTVRGWGYRLLVDA
jgi:two-component system phosphate regulon response regulator OmpR